MAMGDENGVSSDDDDEFELEYEPECFEVAGEIRVNVLSVVPPPLEFMSNLHAQNQEISGRKVWCGSLLLANLLYSMWEKDQTIFENKRILELGSGTGLLGMVVSRLGNPGCVVLTDGDDQAITLLEKNVSDKGNEIDSSVTKATVLRWGDEEQTKDFIKWCHSCWPGLFSDGVSFDYIIAGDVMYKSELPPLFYSACQTLLAEEGTLWLCHIPRASVDHELVVNQAKESKFFCEETPCDEVEVKDAPIDDRKRAKVYRITKQLVSK